MNIATNDDKHNIIERSLENEVPDTQTQNDLRSETSSQLSINNSTLIKNVNNKVLLDILSPEISKNELSKRRHKYISAKYSLDTRGLSQ